MATRFNFIMPRYFGLTENTLWSERNYQWKVCDICDRSSFFMYGMSHPELIRKHEIRNQDTLLSRAGNPDVDAPFSFHAPEDCPDDIPALSEPIHGEMTSRFDPVRDAYRQSGLGQSFIPIDIGKSYLAEAVAFYRNIFKDFPAGYYTDNLCERNLKIDLDETMKAVEGALDVIRKFTYKCNIRKNGKGKRELKVGDVNYILKDGAILYASRSFNSVIVLYRNESQLDEIIKTIVAKKPRERVKPTFKLLTHGMSGFELAEFELKPFSVDLESNYNDDLPNRKIVDFIKAKNESGLCILHGKPGTGKTFYIRNLIRECRRDFIYMNRECLQHINDSSFVQFLVNHKESVFIMEDCENVLVDRTQYNGTISTLLNLSDGLLGDSLNNKFICTFNTDIGKVDKALLRKGRMKVCYEFGYLKKDKANALSEKLGLGSRFEKDTPLCEVLNAESNGKEAIKKAAPIGF